MSAVPIRRRVRPSVLWSLVGSLVLGALALGGLAAPAAAFDAARFDAAIACPADEVAAGRFTDVGIVHGDAIRCVAWYGVANGTTATSYAPGMAVTRGQTASLAVNLLARLTGVELPAPRSGAFDDIDGTTHQDAIETLAAFDPPIVAGLDGDRFDPGGEVTRGQFTSILVGLLDEVAAQLEAHDPLPAGTSGFDDTAGSVHDAAIARLHRTGIIGGFPDGTFRPGEPITRAQVATLLTGTMGGLVDVGVLARPAPAPPPDLAVDLRLTSVGAVSSATAGAVGPDGVLYVADRAGTVHPVTTDGIGAAVVDLTRQVGSAGEGGLLGLAFAADGRELYLSYTDTSGDTAIDAVTVDHGRIRPEQRRRIYATTQPASNHNGGDIHIGPDGLLYIGLGDGGGAGDPAGNGQDLSTPLGALLRIDPQGGSPYGVPGDNPFVGQAGTAHEIYASGLRNPWRFAFDRVTGALYIADVGQSRREEINWTAPGAAAGANFGWNRMEGSLSYGGATEPADHVPPVFEYATGDRGTCAVTGGFVYRGEAIPQLRGAYLYSDLCDPSIRAIVVDAAGQVTDEADLGIDGVRVVSFAQDARGEVYVLNLGGEIQRIDPA